MLRMLRYPHLIAFNPNKTKALQVSFSPRKVCAGHAALDAVQQPRSMHFGLPLIERSSRSIKRSMAPLSDRQNAAFAVDAALKRLKCL